MDIPIELGILTCLCILAACCHAAGYITAWATFRLRPLTFTFGWVCILVLAAQVFIGRMA